MASNHELAADERRELAQMREDDKREARIMNAGTIYLATVEQHIDLIMAARQVWVIHDDPSDHDDHPLAFKNLIDALEPFSEVEV